MYLDTEKDLPVASNAEELNQQLHDIEMYNDRTANQRNYLAQKAQTRYWLQQITNTGGGTELLHFMYGRNYVDPDPNGMRAQGILRGLIEYKLEVGQAAGEDMSRIGLDIKGTHLDAMPGWAAPWQNAGEGLLPTLTGALAGTDYPDLMDDYRSKAYTRMSQDAIDNASKWIKMTSGLDPNQKIAGRDVALGDRTLFDAFPDPGVERNEPYDYALGHYVGPDSEPSPGTFFNPETGDFELTPEEKERRARIEADAEDAAQAAEFDKDIADLQGTDIGGDEGDVDVTLEEVEGAEAEGWGGRAEWGLTQPYELPSLTDGWHWDEQNQYFVSPDNVIFWADDPETQTRMAKHDKELRAHLDEAQAEHDQEQAALDADASEKERREAEGKSGKADRYRAWLEAQEKAQEEDQAAREAKQARYDARHQPYEGRTKQEIEAQKAAFAREDAARAVIDADPDVPDPYANSHGPDAVPDHTHVVPVTLPESIEHEGQHFVPMSAAFHSALEALEAGPAIKVI